MHSVVRYTLLYEGNTNHINWRYLKYDEEMLQCKEIYPRLKEILRTKISEGIKVTSGTYIHTILMHVVGIYYVPAATTEKKPQLGVTANN